MPLPLDQALAPRTVRLGEAPFRIAAISRADAPAVLRLFEAAFGTPPPPAWHAWKYGEGRGEAVGLWGADGTLLAHYAGFPRTLLWQGQAAAAVQIGDVMVAPQARGLLSRRGPFYQVCQHYFETRVGAERPFALAYGFPNMRHLRLGERLDLYDDAGPIHQLAWPAAQADARLRLHWSAVRTPAAALRLAATLWPAMARDLRDHVLGVRDPDYLAWRFLRRPDRSYRFFALRRWPFGPVAALVVLRLDPGEAMLMDIVGPRASFAAALRGARHAAAACGATTLSAWASPAALETLAASGPATVDTAAHLAVARRSLLPAADLAATPWWWLGGDTEFL